MLQPGALARDLGRQRGVIDNSYRGIIDHCRQLLAGDVRIAVDPHLGIAGFCQPLENHRQRFVGVDKSSAHWMLHIQGATPASANTVCISALAPAVQSAWVASSSSLWLIPSLQGTKIIAAGTTLARLQAS